MIDRVERAVVDRDVLCDSRPGETGGVGATVVGAAVVGGTVVGATVVGGTVGGAVVGGAVGVLVSGGSRG